MTALETAPLVITEPGLVRDLPDEAYHSDPVVGGSLSHSGAKTIVNKTPALFAWEREHGRPNKRAFDFGHAAHQMVLGVGPDIEVVQKVAKDGTVSDADGYTTVSSREHRDDIYARGAVPVLRDEMEAVTAMADAIRSHPLASQLLEPGSGEPEISAFVPEPESGVWMRCRYDWLRQPGPSGRLVLVDLKTAVSADADDFVKSAVNYSYHLQDVYYSEIARLLGLADNVAFVFIVIEKAAPYLVNVVQLDITARRIGALLRRRAIDTFKHCTETGVWPGYGDTVNLASLPSWYERRYETDLMT